MKPQVLFGKTAIVGGSSQGIGKAIAMELASMGARVVLLARDENKLKHTLLDMMPASHKPHAFLVADFSQPFQVQAVVEDFLNSGEQAEILINNTGGPPSGPVLEANAVSFMEAFQSHLICNQLLAQLVVPGMKASGYGRIVNIVSTSIRIPLPNLGVSNTIRGAVAGWAKTLANELAPFGITVNNVLPGATRTGRLETIIVNNSLKQGKEPEETEADMQKEIPMKRFGTPEEIAAVACFLASPAASYVTGTSIPVDGGRTGSI